MMPGYSFETLEVTTQRVVFRFRTSAGAEYTVEFKSTGYVFGEAESWADACYEFSIRLQKPPVLPASLGTQIPLTIAAIFRAFFQEREKIILYLCETDDRRQLARVRKFNRWFAEFNRGEFLKIDGIIHDPEQRVDYHNSLIFRKDHPMRERVETVFNELIQRFNAEK